MKKTITMNLSGIIFHIEEDAYEKLSKYLATIKSYFNNSDGKDEIMNDIESRIAEMLSEKVNKNKQAVVMTDVENIIATMGKPEDFAPEGAESTNSNYSTENSTTTSTKRRRVFRDPDNKILSGVCSGIGNYFDFDPLWLRAAFAISFFVFGSGFLLYVILWIIMPEAKTTAEKLEMRGEKVDINNIGKAVNDEFEHLKKRVKSFESEVNTKQNREKLRTNTENFGHFVSDVFHNIIKVFGKVISIILIFIAVALLVGLLATLFGKGTITAFSSPSETIRFSLYELSSAILPETISSELIVATLILFIGVPILSIIYGSIKHLFGIKQKNRIVKYTFNILWLIGLTLALYIAFEIGNDFSNDATTKQVIEIKQPAGNTLYLDIKPTEEADLELKHKHKNRFHIGDWDIISKNENNFRIGYPILTIVPTESDSFLLVASKSANGFDKQEALVRAKKIEYSVVQSDSLIMFNDYYTIDNDKLRAQDVKLILKVPVNKEIFLSKRMERIIFDIDNVHGTIDNDMVDRKWIMTKQGLTCVDCRGLDLDNK